MTHPFEVSDEITVDATPDQVWQAITSGPGVDSWLMGRTEIDSANRTSTFDMFGEASRARITAWEPGHRYATEEEKKPGWHVHGRRVADRVARWRRGSGAIRAQRSAGRGLGGRVQRAVDRRPRLPDQARGLPQALRTAHRQDVAVPAGTHHRRFLDGYDRRGRASARTWPTGNRRGSPCPASSRSRGRSSSWCAGFVGMRTDDAMYVLIHGYNNMVFATAHYFDDGDRSAETEAWQNWLAAWRRQPTGSTGQGPVSSASGGVMARPPAVQPVRCNPLPPAGRSPNSHAPERSSAM